MRGVEAEAVLALKNIASLAHLGEGTMLPRLAPDQPQRALDEERKRISRELHDGVAQELQAIVMHLRLAQGATPDQSAASTSTALALAVRGLAMTRLLLADLHGHARPGDAPSQSLERALSDSLIEATQYSTIEVILDLEDGARISDPIFTELIRMVREIATNAIKHANPSTITCTARQYPARALSLIELRDDGDGFDVAATPHGCGMRGLRERARRVGGTFSVESEPGHGTVIRLSVPILEHQ